MRRLVGTFIAWVFLVAFGCASPALAATKPGSQVQVRVNAPKIEYRTFPAGHPPSHNGKLDTTEAGLCETLLNTQVSVGTEYPVIGMKDFKATVTSVAFTIDVKITIWLEAGAPSIVSEHEETHRAISEHYYKLAPLVARRLAQAAIGRKLAASGKPRDQAAGKAINTLQTELIGAIHHEIYDRTQFAQERFDAITDHSRKNVSNAAAMTQSLREENEQWRRQSAPKTSASRPAPTTTR